MSIPGAEPVRFLAQVRRFLPPGTVWAACLFTAPFTTSDGSTAVVWGIGAVVLIVLFPWALVTVLNRRGDLRCGMSRLGASPLILGAFGGSFLLLRLILWAGGPRALASVVFGMIVAYALTVAVSKAVRLEWADVTYAASAIILPVLLVHLHPTAAGTAGAVAVALLFVGAMSGSRAGTFPAVLAAACVGMVSASPFVWLL